MNLQPLLDALLANTAALTANTAALNSAEAPAKPRGRPVKGVTGDETTKPVEAVQSLPKSDSKPPVETTAAKEPEAAKKPLTFQDVAPIAMAVVKVKGSDHLKKCLAAVGAANLSGVKPDKVEEFAARLQETWVQPEPASEEENLFA